MILKENPLSHQDAEQCVRVCECGRAGGRACGRAGGRAGAGGRACGRVCVSLCGIELNKKLPRVT